MKSKNDMQRIFNTFAYCLENVIFEYFEIKEKTLYLSYIESLREQLQISEYHEPLCCDIFNQTFHSGLVPNGRNHLKVTCESNAKSATCINVWIDLDMLADLLNNHFKVSPPYQYEIADLDRETNFDIPPITHERLTELYKDFGVSEPVVTLPNEPTTTLKFISQPHSDNGMTKAPTYLYSSDFLFKVAALSSSVSIGSFLVLSLALTSIITLSTAAIAFTGITALSSGLAGVTSFRFFKENNRKNNEWSTALELRKECVEFIICSQYFSTPLKIEESLRELRAERL